MDEREACRELLGALRGLKDEVAAEAERMLAGWEAGSARRAARPSLANLAWYLALRRRDLRPLQRALAPLGLSSLGRLEGRVEPNLDSVIASLARLAGEAPPPPFPTPRAFFRGERMLARATRTLLGPREGRAVRILVTLPSEAAEDPALVRALAAAGADAVRINCAHDGPGAWEAMLAHLRAAEAATGRRLRVLMDLAGPKIRTAALVAPRDGRIREGDALLLTGAAPGYTAGGPEGAVFRASLTLPGILPRLAPGERVFLDDGKAGGRIEAVDAQGVRVRIERVRPGGLRLKPEKGVNFPDSDLRLDPLTEKDRADLDFIARHADMVGYSFVQSAADVRRLQDELARRRTDWHRLGLVAKIETPAAVRNLPAITAQALGRQPFGVMIARGDLAVELGFERLAEMQEELLWLCEAAQVPVIWATQVLERFVRKGMPSRGEMTDAAMAARAECVMLNKGPFAAEAVGMLDRVLTRMAEHQSKKTPRLRALGAWAGPERGGISPSA
ncbi:pyruvate kinase [Arenibaculum pallidiluteum]|uniref:pyruvate kinase n=1 Tax=Arenibaculum pallidiluteum TaxID=2812559 RepID=UPI001A970367|nr:pyruvate kinase [Arenibaculum pallidiluteum]